MTVPTQVKQNSHLFFQLNFRFNLQFRCDFLHLPVKRQIFDCAVRGGQNAVFQAVVRVRHVIKGKDLMRHTGKQAFFASEQTEIFEKNSSSVSEHTSKALVENVLFKRCRQLKAEEIPPHSSVAFSLPAGQKGGNDILVSRTVKFVNVSQSVRFVPQEFGCIACGQNRVCDRSLHFVKYRIARDLFKIHCRSV